MALVGCGGGGGGEVNSTPAPVPSSTPTPAPTPLSSILPSAVQKALASGSLATYVAFNDGTVRYASGAISYNQSNNTYTLSNVYTSPVSFGDANATSGSAAGYKYYSVTDPVNGAVKDTILVYDNTLAASPLKYTSLAFGIVPSSSTQPLMAIAFGTPTQTLPTTGTASYSGIVGGLARDSSNTYALSGNSGLLVDFGSGFVTTTLSYSGTNMQSGGAALARQNYFGTSTSAMIGNQFTGKLSSADGTSNSGVFAGRFNGPNADEYGYTFSIAGNGLSVAGAAAGSLQSSAAPASLVPQLPAGLLGANSSYNISVNGNALTNVLDGYTAIMQGYTLFGSGINSSGTTLGYNATTGAYVTGDQYLSQGRNAQTFGSYTTQDLKSFDGNYSTYTKNDPTFSGLKDLFVLYTPPYNTPLSLTYTGFSLATVPGDQTSTVYSVNVLTGRNIVVTLPTSGTATYNGTVAGFARDAANTSYSLFGNASLSADFSNRTYSTNLSFFGAPANGTTTTTQNYSANGNITPSGSGQIFSGNLSGANGTTGSGFLTGMFTGPNATEFGYIFSTLGGGLQAVGVAVGKKN